MASPAPIPRVRRSTLGEEVYETLKALVMEHTLPPGDRINIDALARELDVSPTPVREGLARLESDGLVRKRPLAGYTVSPLLTRAEFNDMFDMRLVLEGAAARWAAERANAEFRAEITKNAKVAAQTKPAQTKPAPATRGNTTPAQTDRWHSHAEFTNLDAQFHDLIAEATGNPLLRDSIARLHAHLHLHRLFFPFAEAGTTGREHRRVAAAIRAGDADAAEAAMREHLNRARERHLPAFTTGGAGQG
jgi:DNA-binding GntR family transcriptional regulator